MGAPREHTLKGLIRTYLLLTLTICSIVILFGASLNNLGIKYSRVTSNAPLTGTSDAICTREIFSLSIPDSNLCCEGLRRQDWVCIAVFDHINRIMTSMPWAYVLPILPWLCTTLFSKISDSSVHLKRLFLYVFLFAFRAIVVYALLKRVQKGLNDKLNPITENTITSCWYESLRECNDHFDFSDHIVFYTVNVILPCTIEASWIIHEVLPKYGGSVTWSRCVPTLIFSLVLCFFSLRSIMFTTLYFHTPMESAVALLLVICTVLVPLYIYADRICAKIIASK